MSKGELAKLMEQRDKPIREFLVEMEIEKRMQDILLYAIGNVNENQIREGVDLEKITTF